MAVEGEEGLSLWLCRCGSETEFQASNVSPFLLLEQILDSLMDAFLRICHWQRLSHGVREPQEMKEMKLGPLAKLDCLLDKLI